MPIALHQTLMTIAILLRLQSEQILPGSVLRQLCLLHPFVLHQPAQKVKLLFLIFWHFEEKFFHSVAEAFADDVLLSPYCGRAKSSKAVRRKQYSTGRSMTIPVS